MSEANDLRGLIAASGLARVADRLEALARPAIRLWPQPPGEGDLVLGQSRFGGWPDLPQGVEWPHWHGVPLACLAQVNLADVRPYDVEGALPPTGWLTFFYEIERFPWGYDPADRGGWWVYFHANAGAIGQGILPLGALEPAIRPTAPPAGLPDYGHFKPCALRFAPQLTLPAPGSPEVLGVGLSPEERDRYWDLPAKLATLHDAPDGACHWLLGYPAPIQDPAMALECQLASHGLYCGDSSGYQDPRAAALAPGAADWRLLLQLDSDDLLDWMWGDAGRLYFWIPLHALQQQRFEETWSIVQCY